MALKIDVTTFAEILGKMPVLIAVQRALALILPVIMVGAVALLFLFPPFPHVKTVMNEVLGPQFEPTLQILVSSSFGLAALLTLGSYAYVYTNLINARRTVPLTGPILSVLVAATCFFVIVAPGDQPTLLAAISLSHGLPVALLVAVTATELYLRLSKLQTLKFATKAAGHDSVIGDVFTHMPAMMLTVMIFGVLKAVLLTAGSSDVVAEFNALLGSVMVSGKDNLAFGLTYIATAQFLWLFGIHGPNVLQPVHEAQLVPASIANNIAVLEGREPEFLFTSQFFDLQSMGGSGATLGLVIGMLLFAKSPGTRRFALLAALPSICNVNEPLIYGLPLVLNPVFAIPFFCVPVINTIIMYVAMSTEFMPFTSHQVSWTTPALLNGYVVSGSINGAIVQAICLAVSITLYTPFVRLHEKMAYWRGRAAMQGLARLAEEGEAAVAPKRLLVSSGDQRRIALSLASNLEMAVAQKSQLFLEYQPQFNHKTGRVYGVEALLRWLDPVHGKIPASVTIQLAEELGIMSDLGKLVLDKACAQRKAWKGSVPDDFKVSVNIAPSQILEDRLDETVFKVLDRHELPTHALKLEITETTRLIPDDAALASLERLRQHGVNISLDDFGMGHTSLRYLKSLPLDEVKIDKSLTLAEHSTVNDHIITSILDLSKSLAFETIVEGVETEEQLIRLMRLGCSKFQGYHFCRPKPAEECLEYVLQVDDQAVVAA